MRLITQFYAIVFRYRMAIAFVCVCIHVQTLNMLKGLTRLTSCQRNCNLINKTLHAILMKVETKQ